MIKFKTDTDPQFLPTLVRLVFGLYLGTYPQIERKFINDQCSTILQRFYEAKGHQKRNFTTGGLEKHILKKFKLIEKKITKIRENDNV